MGPGYHAPSLISLIQLVDTAKACRGLVTGSNGTRIMMSESGEIKDHRPPEPPSPPGMEKTTKLRKFFFGKHL